MQMRKYLAAVSEMLTGQQSFLVSLIKLLYFAGGRLIKPDKWAVFVQPLI